MALSRIQLVSRLYIYAHLLSGDFIACNVAQIIWVKCEKQSVLKNTIFVDDVHYCTNDLTIYHSFKRFKKKMFDLKLDHHINVLFGNHIDHNQV